MPVFWHHVGDVMSKRDFPRTIGTPRMGLREFNIEDVREHIDENVGWQLKDLQDGLGRIGTSTFQIWGVPAGAKIALKKVKTGDWLLLLNSSAPYGFFEYAGRVLLRVPGEQWKLSQYLWGEQKFPLVVFLRGSLIHYPWLSFVEDMQYGERLKGMGRVHSISNATLNSSKFGSEEDFADFLSNKK